MYLLLLPLCVYWWTVQHLYQELHFRLVTVKPFLVFFLLFAHIHCYKYSLFHEDKEAKFQSGWRFREDRYCFDLWKYKISLVNYISLDQNRSPPPLIIHLQPFLAFHSTHKSLLFRSQGVIQCTRKITAQLFDCSCT